MDGKDEDRTVSKEEMYAILLKEFEEFKDEGRDCYFDEVLAEIRKELRKDE